MKFFRRFHRGYTLVELLVVIMITIILSGTIVSFSKMGQHQTRLYVASSQVIDFILQARSLAISAYKDSSLGGRSSCAHGFSAELIPGDRSSFSLNQYLKKQTAPISLCGEIGDSSPTPFRDRYDRRQLEPSFLPEGIEFDEAQTTVADIIFRPPDPQIYFYNRAGQKLPGNSGVIVIRDTATNDRIQVTIGVGGQITYAYVNN